jgi:putative hydrolase of the HAD superfamily
MTLKCLLFDLYGTVIDVETDESMIEIYRAIAHFLAHHGVDIHRFELRDLYVEIMKQQRRASTETHPEIDVVAIWRELLAHRQATSIEPDVSCEALARTLAQLHRAISRNRLALYPDVARVLDDGAHACRSAWYPTRSPASRPARSQRSGSAATSAPS